LRKELIACLRQAHNKRVPRSKGQDRRGQIPDLLSIHVRPPEIEDRQFPWHSEVDLIKGAANASAANVLQAFTDKLLSAAQPMRLSMTYDQGR
jgi:IS30 family transposase